MGGPKDVLRSRDVDCHLLSPPEWTGDCRDTGRYLSETGGDHGAKGFGGPLPFAIHSVIKIPEHTHIDSRVQLSLCYIVHTVYFALFASTIPANVGDKTVSLSDFWDPNLAPNYSERDHEIGILSSDCHLSSRVFTIPFKNGSYNESVIQMEITHKVVVVLDKKSRCRRKKMLYKCNYSPLSANVEFPISRQNVKQTPTGWKPTHCAGKAVEASSERISNVRHIPVSTHLLTKDKYAIAQGSGPGPADDKIA
ncbi:hypothetical protein J6590_005584 [Homalodisca vitripennis]|nr:hypothetical protein J6590_005584 [Homalodisca vitripennis]